MVCYLTVVAKSTIKTEYLHKKIQPPHGRLDSLFRINFSSMGNINKKDDKLIILDIG